MFKITKISKLEEVNEAFNNSNHKVLFALCYWAMIPIVHTCGCIYSLKAGIQILKEGNFGMTNEEYLNYFRREVEIRTDKLFEERQGL
jgi:hypothetical protein